MVSRYDVLNREQLSRLVPELLLTGHLIDRAGMPHCLGAFGLEAMTQIAIEEWSGASPIYAGRMQRALGFEGSDVITIFKGIQLDIGAPPQFMDFRFTVHDREHGEFHLDHCGALCDVEPLGTDYVKAMCHDIEDPTFDATAMATNPGAKIRPIHRPPRTPTDRLPHCAWTVDIDAEPNQLPELPVLHHNQSSHLATLPLDPIDSTDDGWSHYGDTMVNDLDFARFSRSALIRIADEVVVQMHLLNRAFSYAVHRRATSEDEFRDIATRQLIGHAGITAERLHRVLGLGTSPADAAQLLELHPLFNPAAYVDLVREGGRITVRRSPAHEDGGWLELVGPHSIEPLRAIVQAVDPHLDVVVEGTADQWTAIVIAIREAAAEHSEVALTRLSGGADFTFEPRAALPLQVL